MDAAEGSKLQIPSTKSQKGLTTDYADSTDEKHDFLHHPCHPRYPWSQNSLLKPCGFAWELALGI